MDGDAALDRALVNDYDVIVLDRDLPGVHGDEVCGKLAGTVEQFPGQQSRTAVQIAAAYAKDKTEPKEKLVLLTPIVIGKDNLDKAERLNETK